VGDDGAGGEVEERVEGGHGCRVTGYGSRVAGYGSRGYVAYLFPSSRAKRGTFLTHPRHEPLSITASEVPRFARDDELYT